MRIKRAITYMVLLLIIFSITGSALQFVDVGGHWAQNAIEKWSDSFKIIEGDNGKFRPDDSITRAEMATILDRIMVYQTRADNTFHDVSDEWFADAVLKLNGAGVMLGHENYMRPNDKITRQEAVVLIARALQIEPVKGTLSYDDKGDIAPWAEDYISAMTQRAYIQGIGKGFFPKDNLTRSQAVTIFDNIIAEIYSKYDNYAKDVEGTLVINSPKGVTLKNLTVNGDLIICPNVNEDITLINAKVKGNIINFSNVDLIEEEEQEEQEEQQEPLTPPDIIFGEHTIRVLPDVRKNTYDLNGFYTQKGLRNYKSDDINGIIGIDVSSYQGDIDWQKVKAAGVEFAIIRVGYRGYTVGSVNLDKYFEKNIKGAIDAGIHVGVYFFSQAITPAEAKEEADFVLSAIEGYNITYPVVYDWENVSSSNARTNKLATNTLGECAIAFCEAVKEQGYKPMVYFNTYIGLLKYNLSQIKDYDFWFAGYTERPTFYYHFEMWQYTSSGKVDGIPTDVDLNISFVDYAKQ